MNQATATPTTLDSIIQSLRMMIKKADPERIAAISKHMQTIIPADGATINLQSGCNDEDKRAVLTFFVTETIESDVTVDLEELLQRLLVKTPFDKIERLEKVLQFMDRLEGSSFDWDIIKPYYSEGAKSHTCYFYIYKR